MNNSLILVLDNIRSSYNVGSLLRSADGFGVGMVITVGITPHTMQINDKRLPHVISKATKQIEKTALGGEHLLGEHFDTTDDAIAYLKKQKYTIVGVEQTASSTELQSIASRSQKTALILGNEVAGVSKKFLDASDYCVEIEMKGKKESFNVASTGAIVLYHYSQLV